jgi:cell division protein ZapA (FtsZ GTPase activity inhibitor)
MMTPKRIVVSILDQQLHLITDEDERVVHKASRLVEEVLRDIRNAAGDAEIEQHKITLLSALRISLDSLLRSQQLVQCQERVASLNQMLDEILQSFTPTLSS